MTQRAEEARAVLADYTYVDTFGEVAVDRDDAIKALLSYADRRVAEERERCARVAESQRAEDWFEVGKVVVAAGKHIAASIRSGNEGEGTRLTSGDGDGDG